MYVSFFPADVSPDPVAAAAALQGFSHPVLIHSAMQIGEYGNYSFAACDPFLVVTAKGSQVTICSADQDALALLNGEAVTRRRGELLTAPTCRSTRLGHAVALEGNPFDVLDVLVRHYEMPPSDAPFPFIGGAIGYLGYDLGWHLEDLPRTTTDDIGGPDLYLAFYDATLAFCHATGEVHACGVHANDPQKARELAQRIAARASETQPPPREPGAASDGRFQGNFSRPQYIRALEQTIEYIYAGDIFQANLSQRFDARLRVSPWELYCRLRECNPAPFAAYLGFEGIQVVSASPERFLKVVGGSVETRPIKGTRPRGDTREEDGALAQELLQSEKDAAELTMIVDLERNDLGRVCRFGSVKVPELVVLESYPTVHHLVATVVGDLLPGKSNVDLLRASFPGGSITGAPKIRAMEIIDELEPTQRGVYTGCIGYLGFDGAMDLNIVIRTIVVRNGRAYFQVGGGIVADSEPELEYQETLDKGRALAQALDAELPE